MRSVEIVRTSLKNSNFTTEQIVDVILGIFFAEVSFDRFFLPIPNRQFLIDSNIFNLALAKIWRIWVLLYRYSIAFLFLIE